MVRYPRTRDPRMGALLCISFFFGIRALHYLFNGSAVEPGLDPLSDVVPLWTLGLLWLAATVMCFITGWTGRRTLFFVVAPSFPCLLWGCAYLVSQILSHGSYWRTLGFYLAFGGLVVFVGLVRPHPPRATK